MIYSKFGIGIATYAWSSPHGHISRVNVVDYGDAVPDPEGITLILTV